LVEGAKLKEHVGRPNNEWLPAFIERIDEDHLVNDFIFVDFRPFSRAPKKIAWNIENIDKYLMVIYDDKEYKGASIWKYDEEKEQDICLKEIYFSE